MATDPGIPYSGKITPNTSETHLNWNFSILIHPEFFSLYFNCDETFAEHSSETV